MGKCKFSDLWLEESMFKDRVSPVVCTSLEAYFNICKKTINITWMGVKAYKSHMETNSHQARMQGPSLLPQQGRHRLLVWICHQGNSIVVLFVLWGEIANYDACTNQPANTVCSVLIFSSLILFKHFLSKNAFTWKLSNSHAWANQEPR